LRGAEGIMRPPTKNRRSRELDGDEFAEALALLR
jgi:hypothetical protein